MSKPREFWLSKGRHYGSKLRVFTKLFEAEALAEGNPNKHYDIFPVVEKQAYDSLMAECEKLAETLDWYFQHGLLIGNSSLSDKARKALLDWQAFKEKLK